MCAGQRCRGQRPAVGEGTGGCALAAAEGAPPRIQPSVQKPVNLFLSLARAGFSVGSDCYIFLKTEMVIAMDRALKDGWRDEQAVKVILNSYGIVITLCTTALFFKT